jgi:hypothetical protein
VKSRLKKSVFGIISWFFLAVLLYLSIFGWNLYRDARNTPQRITRECRERILETELKTAGRVATFLSGIDTTRKKLVWPKDVPGDDGEEDIFIFAFRNDTLVFWNDNSVILSADFTKQVPGKTFVAKLQNGWYGFVCDSLGPYRVFGCYLVKSEFPFENDFIENRFNPALHVPENVGVIPGSGEYPVVSGNGNPLFSLSF